MGARWAGFAVGLALVLAPLVLGHGSAGAILLEVALGLAVCVATLAAIERPALRITLAFPAIWLAWSGASGTGLPAAFELGAGVLVALLALVPGGASPTTVRVPGTPARGRAGARAG